MKDSDKKRVNHTAPNTKTRTTENALKRLNNSLMFIKFRLILVLIKSFPPQYNKNQRTLLRRKNGNVPNARGQK
jgi:hypothetical protein